MSLYGCQPDIVTSIAGIVNEFDFKKCIDINVVSGLLLILMLYLFKRNGLDEYNRMYMEFSTKIV